MKQKFKKFIPFILVAFFMSMFFCCCVSNVQAESSEEKISSCHSQENSAKELTDKNNKDCECDSVVSLAAQSFALENSKSLTTESSSRFFVSLELRHVFLIPKEIFLALQAPPKKNQTFHRLYIENAILRI